jgi:hypothetical protein
MDVVQLTTPPGLKRSRAYDREPLVSADVRAQLRAAPREAAESARSVAA